MREVKFRGLDISGKWHYGLIVASPKETSYLTGEKWFISDPLGMPFAHAVRPETIGEVTSFKDSKGTQICEGDILRVFYDDAFNSEKKDWDDWNDVEVQWIGDGGCLGVYSDFGDYDITSIGWAIMEWDAGGDEYLVVGNIHDKKELNESIRPNAG